MFLANIGHCIHSHSHSPSVKSPYLFPTFHHINTTAVYRVAGVCGGGGGGGEGGVGGVTKGISFFKLLS